MNAQELKLDPAPFRPVGFRAPTVVVDVREDGALLLQSSYRLPLHPPCVTDWLQHWADVRGSSPMLVERDADGCWQAWSCAQVWDAVRAIAWALLWHGAGAERPLAILSENSTEQALLTWGALYAGVPVAPISPPYSLAGGDHGRLRAAVAVIRPYLYFVQDAQKYGPALAALEVAPASTIAVHNASVRMLRFADWVGGAADPNIDVLHKSLLPHQPAKYMFTSGSTGIPKAVVQTRAMLAAAQEMAARIFEQDPDEAPVYLEWLPWHHVMGGNIVQNRILRFGGTLYIDAGKPTPDRFSTTLDNLREIAPTLYFNVPAGLAMLVAELEYDAVFAAHFFSRLKFVYYGGAALSRDVYDRFQALALRITGERIVLTSAYGATETCGPAVTQHWGVDDAGCIGLPLAGVQLKLIEDASLPGRYEMRIKGPNIFQGYLNAPLLSTSTFDNEGFYLLGDAVRFVDPENAASGLRFAGRFAEDFKLGNGTWVRSAALQSRLMAACFPLLKEAVITHDGANRVGALAWPDARACSELIPALSGIAAEALAVHPLLLAELGIRLGHLNHGQRGPSLRIERLALLAEPASAQHYELTDKGSLNQRAVVERRAGDVAALFTDPCPGQVISAPAYVG